MDLTTGIAPRAWLAGLLAGLFAFASITGTSASTQSGSAWVFRDGEDDYGWGCILEGQFSTASDSRLFGRTLYLSVWIDDFDYDEDDYDYVGLTSDPGARLQSGGASAASIVVFYPISGRSRTYTVRNRNPEFNSLEVLRGNFYDDIRRETELLSSSARTPAHSAASAASD